MLISVIIPVYNQEVLIKRALGSIPARKDIEVIVIDDCSTDNTYREVQEFIENSPLNIVLLHNDKNMGVGHTMNVGYDNATGEFVVPLGSDDYFTENFNMILEELDQNYDMVFFDLQINDGAIWPLTEQTCDTYCGSTKFTKRSFLGTSRCPELRFAEDLHLWNQLKQKNPRMKFTHIVAKHYNFPREGSLCWTNDQVSKNRKES